MHYLDLVLEEMFKRVGAKYDSNEVQKDGWYSRHQWTQEEEDDFVEWLADLLYNNRDARRQIMAFPYKKKRTCHNAAKWFCVNYGWKYKK